MRPSASRLRRRSATPASARGEHGNRRLAALAVALVVGLLVAGAPAASAAPTPSAVWSIRSVAQPTHFSSNSDTECESIFQVTPQACDSFTVLVTNIGTKATHGAVTITDSLPAGMTAIDVKAGELGAGTIPGCTTAPVECVTTDSIAPGGVIEVEVYVLVGGGVSGTPLDSASVSGGGAPAETATEPVVISPSSPAFGLKDFSMQAIDSAGAPEGEAGGHPYDLVTTFDLNTDNEPTAAGQINYRSVGELRDAAVYLPLGLIGDPQVTPKCPLSALLVTTNVTACPSNSRIGTLVFEASPGVFRASELSGSETTAVYNMIPEAGYPAEFGFTYLGKPVLMYASVVRRGSGYALRVSVPGIPELETIGVSLTFWGEPAVRDGGTSLSQPFFTNPVDCTDGSSPARIEIDSWEQPGVFHSAEAPAFPHLTDCNLLQFQPSLSVAPDTSQADEPSGYTVDINNPQSESPLDAGTPELKDATVTLPAGVAVSPSAADGLEGCEAAGPHGIDIPNGGGTPVQAGEGEAIGADGMSHLVAGHCPAGSSVGSVQITTPLLPSPLEGHVFLAKPGCGGEGQAPCSETDAADGNLVHIYLEAAGSGVVIKLEGRVSLNRSTGRLTATFKENPQFPFSDLKLHFNGGPRASLANPQACGSATTSSDLSPWSSPATPDATPSSEFTVTGCEGSPFAPSFLAGTTDPTAGAYTNLSTTFARVDRMQDLGAIQVQIPPGLLGTLSHVTQCGEPLAAQGACPAASQIGTAVAASGAGSHPFWVSGPAYLTGPYKGAPFGLSVAIAAKAGPFNLGTVVVRAAVNVDPTTAALTVTSDPLPQILDGVPLRIQTVNLTVNRPRFMFNPTSCGAQQITATISSTQGSLAQVASPFAAGGCRNLPFKPSFKASTQGNGTLGGIGAKGKGASLDVKITQAPGEAAIHKVAVQLPLALPSRLTTLQKACTEAQFAANPSGCPSGSIVGIGTAATPVLNVALTGPAYLVSHGGAAFPDLDIVLQGEGVVIVLTGHTDIKKGLTFSRFETVPDAPIGSFELNLPEGPHSALAAIKSLCAPTKLVTVTERVTRRIDGHVRHVTVRIKKAVAEPLDMPTAITGQNGAVLQQTTKVSVTGCSKPKAKPKAKRRESSH